MILLRYVPNVVESREGCQLYIVTGGVMVGILLSEGALWASSLLHLIIPLGTKRFMKGAVANIWESSYTVI
jgi:hypothetical protein